MFELNLVRNPGDRISHNEAHSIGSAEYFVSVFI